MPKPTLAQLALLHAYAALATLAAPYLAAVLYFAINKTMPVALAWDTWYRYWQVYASDPLQHARLVGAAAVAVALLAAPPLVLLVSRFTRPRSLHGDARWASTREIREAGLL